MRVAEGWLARWAVAGKAATGLDSRSDQFWDTPEIESRWGHQKQTCPR